MKSSADIKKKTSMVPTYLSYGSSEIACHPMFTMLMSFIVYFYTDVVGLSAEIVGTIVLVSRIIDGITDLISGNIVDNTKSRFGYARPWYLWLALPLSLSFVLLFTVPSGSDVVKYLYVFLTYNILASVVYTLMNAAMTAFPILLSERREDRSVMISVRYFIASIIQFFIMMYSLRIVDSLGGGQKGWVKYAIIAAAISFVTLLVIFATTKEKYSKSEAEKNSVSIWNAFKLLFKNKYWIIAVFIQMTFSLLQIAMISGNVYYAKYVLNDISMQEIMSLCIYIPGIITCLVFSFILNTGASKRKLALWFNILTIIGSILIYFSTNGILLTSGLVIRSIGFTAVNVLISGLAIDTAVYGEWKTGISIPSMTVTAVGVGQKIGFGVGTALFGIILGIFGYDGLEMVQPAEAVSAIRISFTLVPIILSFIIAILLFIFKLDYEYPRYEREIRERKQGMLDTVISK